VIWAAYDEVKAGADVKAPGSGSHASAGAGDSGLAGGVLPTARTAGPGRGCWTCLPPQRLCTKTLDLRGLFVQGGILHKKWVGRTNGRPHIFH
jgi:hypothetical protein